MSTAIWKSIRLLFWRHNGTLAPNDAGGGLTDNIATLNKRSKWLGAVILLLIFSGYIAVFISLWFISFSDMAIGLNPSPLMALSLGLILVVSYVLFSQILMAWVRHIISLLSPVSAEKVRQLLRHAQKKPLMIQTINMLYRGQNERVYSFQEKEILRQIKETRRRHVKRLQANRLRSEMASALSRSKTSR